MSDTHEASPCLNCACRYITPLPMALRQPQVNTTGSRQGFADPQKESLL